MKFLSIDMGNSHRLAVTDRDDAVLLPAEYNDLVDVVQKRESALPAIKDYVSQPAAERLSITDAKIVCPIRRFRRDVLCTGWNYWDHFEESRGRREGQDVDRPSAPTFFSKSPDSVIAPYDPIAFVPELSTQWDYEAEIAIVIGRTGRNITTEQAADFVFGYTLANDVTLRDVQRRHGGQWLKGKSIDATTPIGPVVVTADEIEDRSSLRIQCRVNGELRQDAHIGQMAFSIEELISELSRGMTLVAGDLLLTGTPAGIGNARTPQAFLQEGDLIEIQCDQIGILRNRVERSKFETYEPSFRELPK